MEISLQTLALLYIWLRFCEWGLFRWNLLERFWEWVWICMEETPDVLLIPENYYDYDDVDNDDVDNDE